MRKRKKLIVGSLVVACAVGLLFLYHRDRKEPISVTEEANRSEPIASPAVAEATSQPSDPSESEKAASEGVERESASEPPGLETLATRRMYLAHAPLREPEVDNPDSAENKRIMQQMISNALSSSERPLLAPTDE